MRSIELIKQYAKDNRKSETRAEAVFWEAVRDRRLGGYKFCRQRPVGQYILDFYCPELKLAIEIDGPKHDKPKQKEYDYWREQVSIEKGIKIIRFTNERVLNDLVECLEEIREVAQGRLLIDKYR